MVRSKLLSAVVAAAAISTLTASSFGAAALAGGAKTSCKPTATSPALRQIQINADPLNVQSYGLTMTYETDLVTINPAKDIFGVNGYTVTNVIVTSNDLFTRLQVFGNSANPLPGEIDVFAAIFTLKPLLPLDTVLHFSVSDNVPNDFITAIDTDTGLPVTFSGPPDANGLGGVAPSFSGAVAILPEPSLAGLIAAGMAGFAGRRRR